MFYKLYLGLIPPLPQAPLAPHLLPPYIEAAHQPQHKKAAVWPQKL